MPAFYRTFSHLSHVAAICGALYKGSMNNITGVFNATDVEAVSCAT